MTEALAHRGPDAGGAFVAQGIGLGHRRLSIIDLTVAGAQPMQVEQGGTVLSYNGEAYNFAQLRRELQGCGCVFRGRSDTEVVLRAYDTWGLDGLKRLEGIFALALWDPLRERLVLMRDRLGVKPLFYARGSESLVFGSEIKALIAAGSVSGSIDAQALTEYLWFGNSYEDRTIYRDARALLPGHWLVAEPGHVRIEPWWRVEEWTYPTADVGSAAQAATTVRTALDFAVARQLVADVPVAIFLSGGVDSSAIAAAATTAAQPRGLLSFTASFDFERGVNELPKARAVAKHLGLEHHELHIRGDKLPDELVSIARVYDEPFADPASIPLYLMARELRGRVKVVLQGDGGDEMFAGYRRYAILRHQHWWRLWPDSFTGLVAKGGRVGARAARMLAAASRREAGERMALLLTLETRANSPLALLMPQARYALESASDPFRAYRACAERFASADAVQQMLLTDISLQLPSQFLTKVDRATMAQGLEARVPLLDEQIARVAVGMPSAWKTRGLKKKIVLREALRGRIPDAVLDAPKTGFGVPYEHWLRGSLHSFAADAVLSERFIARFGFDRCRIATILEEQRKGRRERGFMLWKLLQLALWSQTSAGLHSGDAG
jgi:asparagine synthase (glutamine-hydrolysing)